MLGHQGSASTFPSSLDLVTLEHLRNHGGHPYTPYHCNIELRSVGDYNLNYNENLCDDRSNGSMRENGKFHNSVVEQMLFPIKDFKFVVPPILHVLLGVTLHLYNILLTFCQQIDRDEWVLGDENGNREEEDWLEISMLLSERAQKLQKLEAEVIEVENRIGRIEAALQGKYEDNSYNSKT